MMTRHFTVRLRADIADAIRKDTKGRRLAISQIFNTALRDYYFKRDKNLVELMSRIDELKKVVSELDNATKRAKHRE